MLVLGIETTCDETAAAIVRDGKEILSNVIASQAVMHSPFGGVYPELASRGHIDAIIPVIDLALKEAKTCIADINLISVAKGPGLIGSLLVGLNAAKTLSLSLNVPFVGVNHVEAHLYAAMMTEQTHPLPALGVVVSGGHTFIVHIESLGHYSLIGTTVDDAMGEAFDKIGVMLGLAYPGGPEIEKIAMQGNPNSYPLKAGKVKNSPLDFSFSGLKTNVFYLINGQNAREMKADHLTATQKADIAASFQKVAFTDLIQKCKKALSQHPYKAIYLGGGVTNNKTLRSMLQNDINYLPLFFPKNGLSLDNAAMIAGLGYHVFLSKNKMGDPLDLPAQTRIPFLSRS